MYDYMDSPATVNQSGISGWIDGFLGDGATDSITGLLTSTAQQYTSGWLSEQFPEQYAELDQASAPVDNAVNEAIATKPDNTSMYIKYGAIGLAVVSGVAILATVLRK